MTDYLNKLDKPKNTSRAACHCMQCGYPIASFDDVYIVQVSGETIHKDCWTEYAEDNIEEFIKCMV